MKKAITFLFAVVCSIAATLAAAASPSAQEQESRAAAIGSLMQTWQSRILTFGLPVDDAKNWARRNMAKFSRLNADRLSLAQRAGTLGELELVLLDAPVPEGTHLDVLMATHPGDITMMSSPSVAKSSPATSPSIYSNLVFTALTPCRILDSRVSQGGSGPWSAGSSNLIKIGPYATGYQTGAGAQGGSATSCGLDALAGPGEVAVIMAAVSTVTQVGAGYLTFFPQGAPNPGLTSVSQWYQPGYVQTSFVLIPTDLVGTVAASGFTSAGTEVIIDVVGYFVAVAGNGNITLVPSTATAGNILKGANPFIHNFGVQNTFIGVNAGNFTMTGDSNTASGTSALFSNTTGCCNTASGVSALQNNTTGSFNTASGTSALFSNTTGSQNTASGVQALFSNTTGNNNIALGALAGSNLTTGNYNIDIGNQGVAAEGNTIRIGDGSQTRAFIAGIRGVTTGIASGIAVLIDSNGQLGTISSSRRFKDDIADMDAASSALMKLRPVTFHYKTDQNPSGRSLQYGLIAEEVAAVYPGLVAHSADGQVETVMYQFLPSMLLNEYQKQQRTTETQATHIAKLGQDRDLQTARIAELERERQTLKAAVAEIAGLKAAMAEIAELKQQTAHLVKLLDRLRRPEVVNEGLELK